MRTGKARGFAPRKFYISVKDLVDNDISAFVFYFCDILCPPVFFLWNSSINQLCIFEINYIHDSESKTIVVPSLFLSTI